MVDATPPFRAGSISRHCGRCRLLRSACPCCGLERPALAAPARRSLDRGAGHGRRRPRPLPAEPATGLPGDRPPGTGALRRTDRSIAIVPTDDRSTDRTAAGRADRTDPRPRPPFDESGEAGLMRIACDPGPVLAQPRTAGGPATYRKKIAAARRLGLRLVDGDTTAPAPPAPTTATSTRRWRGFGPTDGDHGNDDQTHRLPAPLRPGRRGRRHGGLVGGIQGGATVHPGRRRGAAARVSSARCICPTPRPWVVEEDGRRHWACSGCWTGEIGGLFVRPDRQGRGWGRRMVDHAAALKGALTVEVFELKTTGPVVLRSRGFCRNRPPASTGKRAASWFAWPGRRRPGAAGGSDWHGAQP